MGDHQLVISDPIVRSRQYRLTPWIIGNLVVLGLFGHDLLTFNHGLISNGAAYWGRDFVNVWTAGHLVLTGRVSDLYDLNAYWAAARHSFGPIGAVNYSYPPLVLPLMVPFALMPYGVALATWMLGTGWLFVRAARPWWQDATGLPGWMVLLTPAALVNIWAGHYGFLIGALLLFGWRALPNRPVLAGICFGLLAIKPHLAILVPLVLLVRGEWRAIGAATATVTVLVIISIALFGLAPWIEYLTVTSRVQAAMIDAGANFYRYLSTSSATAVMQVSRSSSLAALAQAAAAITGVTLVAIAAWRAPLQGVALLAATATFLVLPYAFNYDLTVSAMGAGMLMIAGTGSAMENCLALVGFMAAQLGMVLAAEGLPAMPLLLLGLAIVQFRQAMRAAPVNVGSDARDQRWPAIRLS